jgi:hypothetical protein
VNHLLDPGLDTYKQFLVEWHGPRRPEYGLAREEAESRPMPLVLREFLEFAGKWPGVIVQNRLLPPSEMRIEDAKLVFYVENQGVDIWATAPTETRDAPVWVRENDPGEPWFEEEPLSHFLLQLVVYETVMGAPEGAAAAWLPLAEAEQLSRGLHELPLSPWHRPSYPTRFYAGERLLLVVMPNPGPEDEAYVSLYVGALDADALMVVADHVDDSWDYFSPRDGAERAPPVG